MERANEGSIEVPKRADIPEDDKTGALAMAEIATIVQFMTEPQRRAFEKEVDQWENDLLKEINLVLSSNYALVRRKILASLFEGPKRYSDLLNMFEHHDQFRKIVVPLRTTDTTLSKQLDAMVRSGTITKIRTGGFPPKSEYTLSSNRQLIARAKLWGDEDYLFQLYLRLLFAYRAQALSISSFWNSKNFHTNWLKEEQKIIKAAALSRVDEATVRQIAEWALDPEKFKQYLLDKLGDLLAQARYNVTSDFDLKIQLLVEGKTGMKSSEITGFANEFATDQGVLTYYLSVILVVMKNICSLAGIGHEELLQLTKKAARAALERAYEKPMIDHMSNSVRASSS